MDSGIDIQWERKNGVLLAALVGRVDGGNAEEFQRLMEAGIEPDDHALILDLEHLSFISSAGLRVSLLLARQFSQPGKQFGICTLSGPVSEVITISGFDKMIAVHESRSAALRAVTGESGSDEGERE